MTVDQDDGCQQLSFDEIPEDDGPVVVYTDGACSRPNGPGGWGWATVPDGRLRGSGFETSTTNQRMELMAALDAMRQLARHDRPLEVVSDSRYLVDCFLQRWYVGWRKRGWVNASGKPVANQDLWVPILEVGLGNPVEFRWVKGHSGDAMNDLADELAVAQREVAKTSAGG